MFLAIVLVTDALFLDLYFLNFLWKTGHSVNFESVSHIAICFLFPESRCKLLTCVCEKEKEKEVRQHTHLSVNLPISSSHQYVNCVDGPDGVCV